MPAVPVACSCSPVQGQGSGHWLRLTAARRWEAVQGSFFLPWLCQHLLCCELSVKAKELEKKAVRVGPKPQRSFHCLGAPWCS